MAHPMMHPEAPDKDRGIYLSQAFQKSLPNHGRLWESTTLKIGSEESPNNQLLQQAVTNFWERERIWFSELPHYIIVKIQLLLKNNIQHKKKQSMDRTQEKSNLLMSEMKEGIPA